MSVAARCATQEVVEFKIFVDNLRRLFTGGTLPYRFTTYPRNGYT